MLKVTVKRASHKRLAANLISIYFADSDGNAECTNQFYEIMKYEMKQI